MVAKNLLEPVLTNGIRSVNFFNGRLLTAEDLRAERAAGIRHRRLLGRATGEGIVDGLWVTIAVGGGRPVLRVERGSAVNRAGQVLDLPLDVEVALLKQNECPPAVRDGFAVCTPPPEGTTLLGRGVYLLVMEPSESLTERAPRSGLAADGRANGCDAGFVLESVRFRLVRFDPSTLPELTDDVRDALATTESATDVASVSLRRNLLAHLFFGTLARREAGVTPFRRTPAGSSSYRSYGALDHLRTLGLLCDCDVPLAMVSWLGAEIDFVDPWAARRRVVAPPRTGDWPHLGDDRAAAEREASFLQFEHHLRWLSQLPGGLSSIEVVDAFRFLPAAGVVAEQRSGNPGVVIDTFFGELPHRPPAMLDAAWIDALIEMGTRYEPIDVSEREMVWLYQPWQTRQRIDGGATIEGVVVFASPHLPEVGHARFDVARWDYANHAL